MQLRPPWGPVEKLPVFFPIFLQLDRAQTIFFFGFLSGPDKFVGRVRKLPPDRQVVRSNNQRAERSGKNRSSPRKRESS